MNGAQILHFKSSLVEEAVSELINMLLDVGVASKEGREKDSAENNLESVDETPGTRRGSKRDLFFEDIY